MWFNSRSTESEWMDDGLKHISVQHYNDALRKLDKIGRFLGGDQVIYKELKHLAKAPKKIIDVGCGGGHLALRLAQKFPQTEIIGLDISPEAISFAQHEHQPLPANLHFILCNKENIIAHLNNASVITTSLVCHHLTNNEIVRFISSARDNATQAVILNDLHRHCLAYASYALIAPLAFQNRMITHDGLISIKRAFHRQDWGQLLNTAGVAQSDYSLKWYFPFRWGVHIKCQ